PKDSPFDLVAYTNSDYARASLDRKSTIEDLLTKAFDNGIGVNAGDSKLMLPGINLLLLEKVNAARHKLTTARESINLLLLLKVNAARYNLQLLLKVNATRHNLQLLVNVNAVEGTDCLPNATIFEELTRIGAKTTTWNEFSRTMASAIICLATNQKFNFSKYIFESMVKNLDNAGKFLMYPRFIQVFLDNQLEGMSSHKRIYVTPSHTKKIFANMRRQGKDFSGRETPLFPTMVVQAQEEMGEGSAMPTDPHHTPIITQPSSSQPQRKQKSRRPKEKDTQVPQSSVPSDPTNVADEAVNEEPSMQLKELMDFCTKLQQRVLDLENTKTAQAQEITSLKKRVKKLEKKGGSRTHKLKRLYKNVHDDDIMFDVSDLAGEEVFIAEQGVPDNKKDDAAQVNTAAVSTASTVPVSAAIITEDEITLAQALAELKSVKPTTAASTRPKAKGLAIHEEGQATTPIKKDQIRLDKEIAFKLQAKKEEEEKLAREKVEANVALTEEWNDIQAKI
ncbi:hypothetical protein Tco_0070856, partial [Tanacetum coccineum]